MTPAAASSASFQSMNGRPATGTSAFGSIVAGDVGEPSAETAGEDDRTGARLLGDDRRSRPVVDAEAHLRRARAPPSRRAAPALSSA